MKKNFLKLFGAIGLVASLPAFAATVLFEDFSGPISLDKFWGMEESVQLDTANHVLSFSARGKAYSRTGRGNNLSLSDPTNLVFQADLMLTELETGNPSVQNALLGVSGTYYNSDSAAPVTQVGDVFVRLAIGDRGNGPEAWYELQVSTTDDFSDGTLQTGSFGAIELNTTYPASITYDGDNSFTFVFNNGAAVIVDGPPRLGSPNAPLRTVGQRLRFGRDNSQPDAWEVLPDDGSIATISGTVDNVATEGGLLDDFSAASLNNAIWNEEQTLVAVVDEEMEMRITGQGETRTERFWIKKKGLTSFGATLTLLGDSTINDTTGVRGRLTHFLSNDTYDIVNGDIPNGWEGFVWTQFLIERSAGNSRVVVYASRAKDADWTTEDELFWIDLGPINLDQAYKLLIEKVGTVVNYKLDGALVHSFDLATDYGSMLSGNDYTPVGDTESGLQARVQNDAGEVRVRFDDVVTDHQPPTVALEALNVDDDQLPYPSVVNAHEGEIIDLLAVIDDPTRVRTYVWKQESGPDVVVVSGTTYPVIGMDSSLSFTVPVGADKETLGFRLTVVDDAGFEVNHTFEVGVDNDIDSTLDHSKSIDDILHALRADIRQFKHEGRLSYSRARLLKRKTGKIESLFKRGKLHKACRKTELTAWKINRFVKKGKLDRAGGEQLTAQLDRLQELMGCDRMPPHCPHWR